MVGEASHHIQTYDEEDDDVLCFSVVASCFRHHRTMADLGHGMASLPKVLWRNEPHVLRVCMVVLQTADYPRHDNYVRGNCITRHSLGSIFLSQGWRKLRLLPPKRKEERR